MHTSALNTVEGVLFLGKMETCRGACNRDAEKMAERVKVSHGKFGR
jgi:hypothetical protein